MATILRINKEILYSIRLKIALSYLALIAVGFFSLLYFITRYYEDVELSNKEDSFRRYAVEVAQGISNDYNSADPDIRANVGYRIQKLSEDIRTEQGGQSTRILVLDYSGIVRYESNNDLSTEQAILQRNLWDYPVVRNVLTGLDRGPDPTVLYIDDADNIGEKQRVLYAYAPITNAESAITGMVILCTSLSDIETRRENINRTFIYYFLVISFLVLATSLLVSGTITRPIKQLHSGIRKMAQGHLSERVHIEGRDEVAQLGEAFNAMAERLESLDQARNEFVANASHELRTPLSAVKVLSQSLQHSGENLPPIYMEFLQDIGDEIDRLDNIVEDLLTLVQLDVPETKVVRDDVELSDIVGRIISHLTPLASEKQIEIEVSMDGPCPYYGDGDKLYQVFFNLIHNAVKYTPEKGTVWVGVGCTDQEARITVQDTGIGMDPKEIPHIFDRFYRVDKARSRATGGTGLGLSIAHKIVALHGGRIEVTSDTGKGSTFTVILPLQGGDTQNVKEQ